MPVIPALGRWKLEDCFGFEASLGHIMEFMISLNYKIRPCFKKKTKGGGGEKQKAVSVL